jgi:predicted phage baseplate assembly protein
MIARVQDRLPEWTATNPADFGLALVEAFAYMGDLMSFYIDRLANEAYLSTATQRDSVFNLARTYGYTPSGYKSSTVSVKFTNSSNGDITIPAGTVVYGDIVTGTNNDIVQQVYFTTSVSGVAPANNHVYLTATQGQPVSLVSKDANAYGEYLGSSDGNPNQVFALGQSPVVSKSITVYIKDGTVYSKWKEVDHILDSGLSDQVFTTFTDVDNNVYIQFGNGISGLIPVNLKEIRALYTVGGGELGNINSGTITNIEYVPGLNTNQYAAFVTNISVINEKTATGGADPDSIEVVRYLAPLYLRANSRAVTLSDFNSLALGSGAGKANAISGNTWTSVTLYIAPKASVSANDLAPGYDQDGATTADFATLSTNVTNYITPNLLIGTSLTVQPPTYVDVVLAVQYQARPQYTHLEVEAEIKAALLKDYGYSNTSFAQVIYQQDIEYTLNGLKSVKIAKVTVLHRQGDSGVVTLTGGAGELFRLQEANISLGSM